MKFRMHAKPNTPFTSLDLVPLNRLHNSMPVSLLTKSQNNNLDVKEWPITSTGRKVSCRHDFSLGYRRPSVIDGPHSLPGCWSQLCNCFWFPNLVSVFNFIFFLPLLILKIQLPFLLVLKLMIQCIRKNTWISSLFNELVHCCVIAKYFYYGKQRYLLHQFF